MWASMKFLPKPPFCILSTSSSHAKASQSQNMWCMRQHCGYRELYGKLPIVKTNCVNNYDMSVDNKQQSNS